MKDTSLVSLAVWWSWLANEAKVTLTARLEGPPGGCECKGRVSCRGVSLWKWSPKLQVLWGRRPAGPTHGWGTTVFRDPSFKAVASSLTSLYSEKMAICGKMFCEEGLRHKITFPSYLILVTWILVRYMDDPALSLQILVHQILVGFQVFVFVFCFLKDISRDSYHQGKDETVVNHDCIEQSMVLLQVPVFPPHRSCSVLIFLILYDIGYWQSFPCPWSAFVIFQNSTLLWPPFCLICGLLLLPPTPLFLRFHPQPPFLIRDPLWVVSWAPVVHLLITCKNYKSVPSSCPFFEFQARFSK